MANMVKGEVPFDYDGKAFTFKFGTNTQAIIEGRVNTSVRKFMAGKTADSFGAGDLRLIFWAGLYQKHRLTEEEVGDMIDAMGAEKVSEIFWTAVKSSAVPDKGNGIDADPPQPTPGQIGTTSSSVG